MDTIKLTELSIREMDVIKGGLIDHDSTDVSCLCPGTDVEVCALTMMDKDMN